MTYQCKNAPRPTRDTTYPGQAGWGYGIGSMPGVRYAIYVDIPVVLSLDCQYDASDTDRGCAGCEHKKKEVL